MGYDIKITLKKMGIELLMYGIAGLILFFQSYNLADMPQNLIIIFPVVVSVLKGIENYLKHRTD